MELPDLTLTEYVSTFIGINPDTDLCNLEPYFLDAGAVETKSHDGKDQMVITGNYNRHGTNHTVVIILVRNDEGKCSFGIEISTSLEEDFIPMPGFVQISEEILSAVADKDEQSLIEILEVITEKGELNPKQCFFNTAGKVEDLPVVIRNEILNSIKACITLEMIWGVFGLPKSFGILTIYSHPQRSGEESKLLLETTDKTELLFHFTRATSDLQFSDVFPEPKAISDLPEVQ